MVFLLLLLYLFPFRLLVFINHSFQLQNIRQLLLFLILRKRNKTPDSAAEWFRRNYGESLANEVAIPLTEAQKEELDRRLQTYAENPNEGISWDELKDKLRNKSQLQKYISSWSYLFVVFLIQCTFINPKIKPQFIIFSPLSIFNFCLNNNMIELSFDSTVLILEINELIIKNNLLFQFSLIFQPFFFQHTSQFET